MFQVSRFIIMSNREHVLTYDDLTPLSAMVPGEAEELTAHGASQHQQTGADDGRAVSETTALSTKGEGGPRMEAPNGKN